MKLLAINPLKKIFSTSFKGDDIDSLRNIIKKQIDADGYYNENSIIRDKKNGIVISDSKHIDRDTFSRTIHISTKKQNIILREVHPFNEDDI